MRRIFLMVLAASLAAALLSDAAAQPPRKQKKDDFGKGKGGFGMIGPPQPGQILPPFLRDRLNLTDDQKKQLDAMQKDVDEKLAKILTDDQKRRLKEMPGPGGPGGRGPKGPPPKDKD